MAWYRTLRRRGSPPLSFAKNASAVLLLVLAVACFTYPNQSIDSTYVALSPAGGRLGNKMFHVVSGYGLARRLNRQLYFLIKHDDEGKKFENYLDRIVEAFPRLVDSNVLGTPIVYSNLFYRRDSKNSSTGRIRWRELRTMKVDGANWTLVPLAMNKLGQRTCWMYEDPIKYIHHPAQYLQMDTDCGQNRRFFEEYLPEIRQMLSFSPKVHDDAAPILTQLGSDFKDVMCIHTRQNDFKPLRWSADLNGTLYTSMKLASVHGLTKFYIFGDDKEFMQQLAALLVAKNKAGEFP
ncbi:hypothetical protein Q1695_009068 [Nippostrongylus brasiliensis]|nr:hypothetical protein Q1695_009068 [Nippostrongylus brasiliensis]